MLRYFPKRDSLPGSAARFCEAAALGWPRCICAFVGSSCAFLKRAFGLGRINSATVAPVSLPSETAQALRSKKTISAIRRTVPSKPPPMYIDISGNCCLRQHQNMWRATSQGRFAVHRVTGKARPFRRHAIFRACCARPIRRSLNRVSSRTSEDTGLIVKALT